jgi:hypothetical protein
MAKVQVREPLNSCARMKRRRTRQEGSRTENASCDSFNDIPGTPPTQEKKALSIVIPSNSRGIPLRNGDGLSLQPRPSQQRYLDEDAEEHERRK